MSLLCPSCQNTYVQRTRRPLLVKSLAFILPLKRYRCMKCRKRFYVLAAKARVPLVPYWSVLPAFVSGSNETAAKNESAKRIQLPRPY